MKPAHFYEENALRYAGEARPSVAYVDVIARRALAGSTEAMSELCELLAGVAEALSVTHRVALVARARGLDRDDLRQEAMCAMLRALYKWQPNKASFRTYAFSAARNAILDAINQAHVVSLPKGAARAAWNDKWDRSLLSPRTRRMAEAAAATTVSIDAAPDDDEKGRYPAQAWLGEVERDFERVMNRMILEQAFSRANWMLQDHERRALIMRFGLDDSEPMPFNKMAKKFGVSTERTRQITRRGLGRLATAVGAKPA